MARFDVYVNSKGEGYLVDVQSDLMSTLNTRVVVPLLPRAIAPEPASRLNPIFCVEGEELVMVTQFMAAVPLKALGSAKGTLSARSFEVDEALDMLFLGY